MPQPRPSTARKNPYQREHLVRKVLYNYELPLGTCPWLDSHPSLQGILRLMWEMEAFTIQGDEYIKVDAKPGRLPGRIVIRAITKSLVG